MAARTLPLNLSKELSLAQHELGRFTACSVETPRFWQTGWPHVRVRSFTTALGTENVGGRVHERKHSVLPAREEKFTQG